MDEIHIGLTKLEMDSLPNGAKRRARILYDESKVKTDEDEREDKEGIGVDSE